MPIPYEHKLIPRAKELRRNMTPQEKHLWYDFLAHCPFRFQQQKAIGGFIVDFYCHKAHLAIEVDGSQHYSEMRMQYDAERTIELNKLGVEVIRFSNGEVDRDFNSVCEAIMQAVKAHFKVALC